MKRHHKGTDLYHHQLWLRCASDRWNTETHDEKYPLVIVGIWPQDKWVHHTWETANSKSTKRWLSNFIEKSTCIVHVTMCKTPCVCVCVCVCVGVHASSCMHAYACINAYVCLHAWMHECVCAYLSVCICVHMCIPVHMHVCECACAFVRAWEGKQGKRERKRERVGDGG